MGYYGAINIPIEMLHDNSAGRDHGMQDVYTFAGIARLWSI